MAEESSAARLDADAFIARARAHYGDDGRLPTPADVVESEIFPFEGEFRVRLLDDPVLPEPDREGEGGRECRTCSTSDGDYAWVDDRWRFRALGQPQALPTYILESREHVDLGDMDDALAAELGVITVQIERAIAAVPGVGRVHVCRWGDGGAHFHLWFFARPAGVLQLRGSSLPDWLDVLPPMPAEEWAALAEAVAAGLRRARSGTTP